MFFSVSLIWVLVKRDTSSCDCKITSCSIMIGLPVILIQCAISTLYFQHNGYESVVWFIDVRECMFGTSACHTN